MEIWNGIYLHEPIYLRRAPAYTYEDYFCSGKMRSSDNNNAILQAREFNPHIDMMNDVVNVLRKWH